MVLHRQTTNKQRKLSEILTELMQSLEIIYLKLEGKILILSFNLLLADVSLINTCSNERFCILLSVANFIFCTQLMTHSMHNVASFPSGKLARIIASEHTRHLFTVTDQFEWDFHKY